MLHKKHPFFRKFENLMSEAAARPPIYDLGTSARFAKEVGLVRNIFNRKEYYAGGFNPDQSISEDACDFNCDIQNLSGISNGAAGSVLCISVLEHVVNPKAAVHEMSRILRSGGLAIVSVPFLISYHGKSRLLANPVYKKDNKWIINSDHNGYGDFWRFTHEGLALLFSEAGFKTVDVYPIDGWLISRLEILGLYQRISRIPVLCSFIGKVDRPRLGRMTTMHFIRAQK